MCLDALATVYLLLLGITVVSTLTTISNQLTSLLGSALVTVALAP